jgi:outer membrane protein OmpA-like peptidoglycan-associated protein
LALIFSTPLAAQRGSAGQVELGGYAAFARYDGPNLGLAQKFGVGGRWGLFLSRVFSLDANGDYTVTSQSLGGATVNVARLGATLEANTHVGAYIGAGYERLFYRGALSFQDNGPHVVLGDRLAIGSRTALRVEVQGAYFPTTNAPGASGKPLNLSANIGLSIFSFGGASRDADHDGVPDKRDRCPGTPLGATVDANGCPGDEDGDGVLNGLDKCPGTPKGAIVDAVGCPKDSDGDGVYDGIDVCPDTPAGAIVDASGCPMDSDHDGVFDGLDKCPDTPIGAKVDANGCPLDSDHDGVYDGIDQCPDTPPNTEVDAKGCAIVRDSDGDGVPDNLDKCPNTPPGTKVDANGCPIDSDGDGVPDTLDRCPNTPKGTQVDAVGCPILFEIVEGKARALVLKGVTFESGRSILTPRSYLVLDEVSASLVANPQIRIEISGHTDSVGVRQRNVVLSLARAQAVRAYLARKGVAPSRMVAKGYGPDRPVVPNKTPAGRAQNRRVELRPIP